MLLTHDRTGIYRFASSVRHGWRDARAKYQAGDKSLRGSAPRVQETSIAAGAQAKFASNDAAARCQWNVASRDSRKSRKTATRLEFRNSSGYTK